MRPHPYPFTNAPSSQNDSWQPSSQNGSWHSGSQNSSWQGATPPPNTPRFHVLYWEAKEQGAVSLHGEGPSLCKACSGVKKSWRYRFDNFQACVRSCGKEGAILRSELWDLACVSPCTAIRYDCQQFSAYLTHVGSKALTEATVLGTPLKVHQGYLSDVQAGVETMDLSGRGPGVPEDHPIHHNPGAKSWDKWVVEYAGRIRALADRKGGRAVAIIMDGDGEEILTLGATLQNDDETNAESFPIVNVLVVLGGPDGLKPTVQRKMESILADKLHGIAKICLPGGKQHSSVVLADLFMTHERHGLIPAVDQLLRCGPEAYRAWREAAKELLAELQCSSMTPQDSIQQLRALTAVARGSTWRRAEAVKHAKPVPEVSPLAATLAAVEAQRSSLGSNVGTNNWHSASGRGYAPEPVKSSGMAKPAAQNEGLAIAEARRQAQKDMSAYNSTLIPAQVKEAEAATRREADEKHAAVAARSCAAQQALKAAQASTAADREKRQRNLEKRLRQIKELEQRKASGEELNDDQKQKLDSKKSVEHELRIL